MLELVGLAEAATSIRTSSPWPAAARGAGAALAPRRPAAADEPFSNLDVDLRERLSWRCARSSTPRHDGDPGHHDQHEAFALADEIASCATGDRAVGHRRTTSTTRRAPASADFVGQACSCAVAEDGGRIAHRTGHARRRLARQRGRRRAVDVLLRPDDMSTTREPWTPRSPPRRSAGGVPVHACGWRRART